MFACECFGVCVNVCGTLEQGIIESWSIYYWLVGVYIFYIQPHSMDNVYLQSWAYYCMKEGSGVGVYKSDGSLFFFFLLLS